jgi:diguanylate cyclase (GGDEF)-like protein
VEIHANLLHNLLNRRFLHRASVTTNIILILAVGLFLAYLMWLKQGFFVNLVCLSLAPIWAIFGVICFNFDLIVEIVPIALLIPIQWSVTRLVQQFVSLREKNYELALKVRELAIFNEISKAVNFMGNLDKTLDAILSRAVQVLNAEKGSIFLLDDKYEELVEQSTVYGFADAKIDSELKKQFKSGAGIAGEVFNANSPRLINNVYKDKSFAKKDGEAYLPRSIICVPMSIKESSIGVMNIVNRKNGRFSQEDLQTALTMANQAAVVIEKARLFNLATIDGLTGLVVHRHFQAKMEEEFRRAKRYGKHLSYLMTDIDHFKKFNDTWGHQIGDMVLREVAKCVRASVRDTDVAARYGGEEFAVILPETELEGALQFAERLRQKVEEARFAGPKGDLKVTVSVGVSSIPTHQVETALEMIKLADDALYIAKDNGRNRVEMVKPDSPQDPGD